MYNLRYRDKARQEKFSERVKEWHTQLQMKKKEKERWTETDEE